MTVKNKMSKAQHIRKTHYSVYRSLDAGELTVLALLRVVWACKRHPQRQYLFQMYIQIVNAEKITNKLRRKFSLCIKKFLRGKSSNDKITSP